MKDVIKKLDHIRTAKLAVKVVTVEDNATTITECLIEVERALDIYQVSIEVLYPVSPSADKLLC